MWLWSLHLETLSCARPGSDEEAGWGGGDGGKRAGVYDTNGCGVQLWDEMFGWWGDRGMGTAVARDGQVEGKRVLALWHEAGRREAPWQRRGQERRLSSPKVHGLIAVKVSMGSQIKHFLEVPPSCPLSF